MATGPVIPPLPPGFNVDEAPPLPPGFEIDQAGPAAPAPQKRKVGGLETALRTAGTAAQKAVGMFDMAAAGLAGLFSDAEAERVFKMREERQQGMSEAYAPKPGEEMSLPGQIVGGIASMPIEVVGGFGLQHGVNRSAEVLDRGGSMGDAAVAGGVSGAANVAANLIPVKVGGAVGRGLERTIARRIPGRAAPAVGGAVAGGATGGVLGAAGDVAVVGAENAALPEGEQFVDLQAEASPGVAGGLGAALGAVAGARGARAARGMRGPGQPAPAAEATPGTQGSAGAAGTDLATQREERAAALPVPIKLTKGQKSRKFEDLRFEKETAKDPELGGKLRDNADDQNKRVIENLEAFEDLTGRTETERGNVGRKTIDVLEQKQEAKKAEIRKDYDAAREAGELEAPVDVAKLVDYLDKNRSSATNAGVLSTAEAELVRLGGATKDADGNLVPGQLKLNDIEELRKTIGIGGKKDQTNSHFAGELRSRIDAMTEGAGGQLYKGARKKYADYAAEFKNQGVVRDLLALKKNTTDRTVAFDNVFKRIVLSGDPDDLRAVRRSLNDFGEEGKQVFREIQGQAIKHLREQATGNASRDSQGRPIVSDHKYAATIKAMDKDGRLDDLFGKQGAQQLRDVGDLLKDVYTAPPGVVNTSNTASVLIRWMADLGVSTLGTGIPLPLIHSAKIARDYMKGRKVRKQVNEALGPDGDLPRQDMKPFVVPDEPPPVSRGTDGPAGGPEGGPGGSKTPQGGTEGGGAAPAPDRLETISKLQETATGETAKVLEQQALKLKREARAEQVRENRAKEAEQLERTAAATDDPDLRQALMARAAEIRPDKIPTGQATELEPGARGAKAPTKPLPVGEAKELTAEQAAEIKPSKRERELQRLRDDTTDPEVQKDLDKAITAERKRAADERRGAEYLRLADQASDPGLRAELEAKAKKFGVQREAIPVPEVVEIPITPETTRAVTSLANDAAEEAAWRQVHRFGDLDAKASKTVAEAITYDAAAVDRAMQQHERSPRLFEREISRIIEEGKANASKSKQAGPGGKGLEPDPDPPSGGTPAKPRPPRPDGPAAPGAERKDTPAAGGQDGPLKPSARLQDLERSVGKIPEQKGLAVIEREIEGRFAESVKADPDGYLERYAELPETMGGKVVNTDEARALWPEYNDSNESRALYARAVHEPASWIAKAQWSKLLAEPPKSGRVMVLGGGGGSGKTSSLGDIQPGFADRYDAIYDTTLASFDKAKKSIDEALASGREVAVNFTVREPLESITNGIIPRAARSGRTVPLEVAAKAHQDAPQVFQDLRAAFIDDPRVTFQLIDNTGGQGKARFIPTSGLPAFDYNGLADRAKSAAAQAYEKGRISQAVYRGLVGDAPAETGSAKPRGLREDAAGSSRSDAGGKPEPQRPQGTGPQAGQVSPGGIFKDAPRLGDSPVGRVTTATTERGTEIPVRYRLVDIDRLITSHDNDLKPNAAFPQELQPRDRSRASSEAQISRIENNINPKLLAGGSKASDGAPIVGADGVVESGNARTIAVRRAYDDAKADKYRTWLVDNAHKYGLTAKQVQGMKRPMLVRQAGGDYDRAEFARQANESAVSSMSETEVATSDAKRLPDLEGLATNDDGTINLSQSGDFVRDFMRVVVGPTERNALMTADGRLSQRGQARVRNAVFSKAYGDAEIVSMLTESTDANVKNILAGMLRAAPEVARVRELLEAGARKGDDFAPDLADAVRRFSALREKGMSVAQDQAQGDLMGDGPSPRVVEMMSKLEANARAPKRIAEMLKGLVDEIDGRGDPRQAGMF